MDEEFILIVNVMKWSADVHKNNLLISHLHKISEVENIRCFIDPDEGWFPDGEDKMLQLSSHQ